MNVRKMAWRNVWRSRRRTLVTVAAMTFALFVMVLYSALMEGYLREMELNILDLEVGDVQIFADDYRENPSIYTRIDEPDAVLGPLRDSGFPATARLLAFGLAAADESSAGVSLRGIDVRADATVSRINQQLGQGRWLDSGDPTGVVIGRRLARMLDIELGGEILVLSQGTDGSSVYDLFRVRGVLLGIGDATDRSGVFMTSAAFRELMVVPEGAHQIIVRRPGEVDLATAVGAIERLAGELDVRTWRELMPTIASLLDSARAMIYAMFFIVYIAVGILILNAMLMSVFERIREIGVLRALGVGPFDVIALIALESAIQTGIALSIGLALALPGLAYLSLVGIDLGSLAGISIMGVAMQPVWHAAVSVRAFVGPVLTLVTIVALAVVYPALKAALIRPVEAMRQQ